ncbi:alkaline phosphatase family protein [Flagellimonas hymeniacidonis]|uniref:Alkaline phosphatase family protein n=1 Tax=Flagellimonas hymeniacidonis TaxID=2603628 RepID=A0A5C8V9B6_9FLAO|nr:alkaline phosphatase PafA [Flagellimonas hymeniacidonis]TXN38257.1 alkaline phosphatase family protein [Flagellimonas hymeniacidonis]
MAPIKVIKIAFILMAVLCSQYSFAQHNDKPKLVVGIVVDQMRQEYLYRFWDNYSENGFKRLIRDGFNVKNMHYNYVPTATGPGHASIYTGSTPANHGIVANDWYNREKRRPMYCAEDEAEFLVDGPNSEKKVTGYSRSPKNLKSNTITDELKLFSNGRSKVTGISLKDRGAIFPAGHLADYAFWYNTESGDFITSSYYSDNLPKWLNKFNKRKVADSLLNVKWEPLLPLEKYSHSGPDASSMEKLFVSKKTSEFPYDLKKLRKKNGDFALLPQVPFGNTLLTQMAKATIKGEKMGQDDEIDFLTISYSSTDYVGHGFGIRSKELEDTYVRIDRELSELLGFLDDEVGKGNYLLFLTADHAASDHPPFLESSRLPGKFFDTAAIKDSLNRSLWKLYGQGDYISHLDKIQVYLNTVKTSKREVLETSIALLESMEGIAEMYVPYLHNTRNFEIDKIFRKSYHRQNSGDILLRFKPGWMPKRLEGTTHGTAYNDDTHVPMLWYGWKVPLGTSIAKHTIDQIVPTLSFLLDIPLPSNASSEPIHELFD